MTIVQRAGSFAATLLLAGTAFAQTIDTGSEEFLNAATVVTSYDHFMENCNVGTVSAADVASLESWETDNLVPQFRAYLEASDLNKTGPVWAIRDDLAAEFENYGITGCFGALALITTPQADLFATAPAVMAALGSASAPQPQTSTTENPQTTEQPRTTHVLEVDGVALELRQQIDSFAFDANYGFGIGGFMTIDVVPVVLFTTGDVLLKIEQLSLVDGIEAGKAHDPEAWSRWRRQGNEIQVERSAGWENLPFTATYSELPPGFELQGRYLSLGGGGNVAFGGTTSVASWSEYLFLEGGVVVRGGGASGSSEFGGTSVVVASLPADQRGRYEIDGLMLTMHFDDGAVHSYVLVTDPSDTDSVIWLDGVAYSPR